MNIYENVRRAFRSKYAFDIQLSWLQPCITWLRDQFQLPDLTNNYALEKIYNQWLHTDLSLITDAYCLPNDLDLNAKKVQLTGKYALQINSILCISEPYYTQVLDIHGDQNENERIDTDITETQQWKPPAPKRVLYFELTDGKILLRGLEYEPISGLDRDLTLPGAKILVSGPVTFRRGILLLTSKNTQILGGYVENLFHANGPIETTLISLSKTASKLEESRKRFDRLNMKVHREIISTDSTTTVSSTRTNQTIIPHDDEDEMDEFIRQAYADGMLNDENDFPSDPIDYNIPPASTTSSSIHRNGTSTIPTGPTTHFSAPTEQQPIIISDDENDDDFIELNFPSPTHNQLSISNRPQMQQTSTRPTMTKINLPYTYLSLIREQISSLNTSFQDYSIKGCFSSLASNPRVVKNEFDLQAYVNDGSDCILVRLASDLLGQRIGLSAIELLNKRQQCKNDIEKQKFQSDFNERLKRFGHDMQHLNALMTIRFFSDKQIPLVVKIDDN